MTECNTATVLLDRAEIAHNLRFPPVATVCRGSEPRFPDASLSWRLLYPRYSAYSCHSVNACFPPSVTFLHLDQPEIAGLDWRAEADHTA